MIVFVTGVAGFVGTHLARHCLAEGDEVWGTVRPGGRAGPAGVRVVEADVRDVGQVAAALRRARPEAVVHLAGRAETAASASVPARTMEVNAGGAVALLHAVAAAAPGAHVVLAGSAAQYGAVEPDEIPIREEQPFRPVNPYGLSKVAAETAGRYAARVLGLRVVALRAFNQIGPGQSSGFVASDFARQIARAERGWDLPVLRVGDLAPRRDFTDVRDMARAYRFAAERRLPGPAYNVGSGRSREVREVLDGLRELARIPFEVVEDPAVRRPLFARDLRADASRFAAATGWQPMIPFEASLADALDAWRAEVEAATPA